jgi:hypothetical protein
MKQDNTDALKALGWVEPTVEEINSLRQVPPEKVELGLLDVSQQRELLTGFVKHYNSGLEWDVPQADEDDIDEYLASL